MPIDATLIGGGQGVVYIHRGAVTADELLAMTHKALARPEIVRKVLFCIIDQSDVALSYEPMQVISRLQILDKKLIRLMHKGFVQAIIAPSDLAFGYARMWQALSENEGWESRVVRSRAEAVAWVRARVKERFAVELPEKLLE
jgi:hypothetical protein